MNREKDDSRSTVRILVSLSHSEDCTPLPQRRESAVLSALPTHAPTQRGAYTSMMITMMIALLALQPLVKASNIFADNPPYVNDIYRQRLQTVLSKPFIDNRTKTTLRAMQRIGSAFWVDRIAKIRGSGVTLQSVVADASKSVPRLVVAVLYNVPNRDCHAEASNGELCCQYAHDGTCAYAAADASCSEGLNRYRKEYVDEFASVLELYPAVPVAIVIEPDSLANLATNMAATLTLD